jgi:hypothetical protein
MSAPGCYVIAVDHSAYAGALSRREPQQSLNPPKRTAQVHVQLQLHPKLHPSGNKGFARLLKQVHPNERARVTRGCIVFGYNDIHPEKIAQLLGGTAVTKKPPGAL